jgi:hypothetical protein
MDFLIVGIVILIAAIGAAIVFVVRTRHNVSDENYPKGRWMGIGIGIGMGIGMPTGVVMGILMESIAIGILLGLIFGLGIGAAIGSSLEQKHADGQELLSEKEKKYLQISTKIGIGLFVMGLILLAAALLKK